MRQNFRSFLLPVGEIRTRDDAAQEPDGMRAILLDPDEAIPQDLGPVGSRSPQNHVLIGRGMLVREDAAEHPRSPGAEAVLGGRRRQSRIHEGLTCRKTILSNSSPGETVDAGNGGGLLCVGRWN